MDASHRVNLQGIMKSLRPSNSMSNLRCELCLHLGKKYAAGSRATETGLVKPEAKTKDSVRKNACPCSHVWGAEGRFAFGLVSLPKEK